MGGAFRAEGPSLAATGGAAMEPHIKTESNSAPRKSLWCSSFSGPPSPFTYISLTIFVFVLFPVYST